MGENKIDFVSKRKKIRDNYLNNKDLNKFFCDYYELISYYLNNLQTKKDISSAKSIMTSLGEYKKDGLVVSSFIVVLDPISEEVLSL